MTHAHELTQVRQEALERLDPRRRPAVSIDGVGYCPNDARAVRTVEAHVQAVPGVAVDDRLVVHRRDFHLRVGEERVDVHQLAVGQLAQARDAFVEGVVVLEVPALAILVALSAKAESCKEDFDAILASPVGEHQHIALRPARFVDQPGSGRPQGIVECRFVQRRHDAFKQVLAAHGGSVPRSLVLPDAARWRTPSSNRARRATCLGPSVDLNKRVPPALAGLL